MKNTPPKTLQVSCAQTPWTKPIEYNLELTLRYISEAARAGSRVVVFPETNLTGYYFPYVITLKNRQVEQALAQVSAAAKHHAIWVIVGTFRKTSRRYLNIAHVIDPEGRIVHEYAKTHLAGTDEKKYCRAGDKLSLFHIDGIPCTLIICRDGRHPETYRLPAMAGAKILFQPSCSSDDIETITWKRTAGRAQQPVGPNTHMFHCVANTVGQSPDGKQSSSGASFIRDTSGLSLSEADWYSETLITATLDLSRADRCYVQDSIENPPFLKQYWQQMIEDMKTRADDPPV